MTSVLITEPVHEDGINLLAEAGFDLVKKWELSDEDMAPRYAEIEAVFARTNRISAEMMEKMPKLRIVAKHGVGCDTIDVAYARSRNIIVAITSDGNAPSVAEHTLMFMLNCAKTPVYMDSIVRGDYSQRTTIKAFDIGAKTVFILGYGRIGTRVARLCQAFGMRVLISDEKFAGDVRETDGFEVVHDIDEGLAAADFLTVHIPLTDKTQNIIDRDRLSKMPKGAFVINCARGGIIDEQAIADLTRSGHLGGAGFDVYSAEPVEQDNPLLKAERCWLSPHTAAFTAQSLQRMSAQSAQNIIDMFNGGVPERNIYSLDAFSS